MTRLLDVNNSVLMVIDIQERFVPVIFECNRVIHNSLVLMKAARELGVPVVITEQYPQGLGNTVPELLAGKPAEAPVFEKTTFGCLGNELIRGHIADLKRKQVVLCGIEAQVCLNQTNAQLLDAGYGVWVCGDAISSRTPENYRLGMAKMTHQGAVPTCVESILFEWLRDAKHPAFKTLLNLVK